MKKIVITEEQLKNLAQSDLNEGIFDWFNRQVDTFAQNRVDKITKRLKLIAQVWYKVDKKDGRIKNSKNFNNMSWLDFVSKYRVTQEDLDKATAMTKMTPATKKKPVNPDVKKKVASLAQQTMQSADMTTIKPTEKAKFANNEFLKDVNSVKEFQSMINRITNKQVLTSGVYDLPTYEILKSYRLKEKEIPKPDPILKPKTQTAAGPGTQASTIPSAPEPTK